MNPWCTRVNTADPANYSQFWCSSIKCVMQRPLDTGDTDSDWAFDATGTSTDASSNTYTDRMVVMNDRAQLWISSTTYTTAFTAPRTTIDRTADSWANP